MNLYLKALLRFSKFSVCKIITTIYKQIALQEKVEIKTFLFYNKIFFNLIINLEIVSLKRNSHVFNNMNFNKKLQSLRKSTRLSFES